MASMTPEPASSPSTTCVICLGAITDLCEASPCGHNQFDYLCLLTWLNYRPTCPLCVARVTTAKHALGSPSSPRGWSYFTVPEPEATSTDREVLLSTADDAATNASHSRRLAPPGLATFAMCDTPQQRERWRRRQWRQQRQEQCQQQRQQQRRRERALRARAFVYQHNTYSMHVGSNSRSGYREISPQLVRTDERLAERARMWIERELSVFELADLDPLNPAGFDNAIHNRPATSHNSGRAIVPLRRVTTTATSLTEHIIAIIKEVDIQGSRGVAVDILADFLGQKAARLFLHELRSWLRSPFSTPEEWDRHVQYAPLLAAGAG